MASEIWSNEAINITPPTLPSSDATLSGMGETQASAGADGMASFSVPLKLCSGRGTAPECSLFYNAAAGNSELGIGWSLQIARIVRSTAYGVPRYQNDDVFIAPDGSELTYYLDDKGQPEVRHGVNKYQNITLDQAYSVWRYRAQIENSYDRIELWQGEKDAQQFWIIHHTNGNLSCFGRTKQARLADEADPSHIGEWYQEELLAVNGEHICFHYRQEDSVGVTGEANRAKYSWKYLQRIDYANVTAQHSLYCWQGNLPEAEKFLLHVVFDYGERALEKDSIPNWDTTKEQQWPKRDDSFSFYMLGFEARCHRLCHQILMFSRSPENLAQTPTLVNRYLLDYAQDSIMSCLKSVTRLAYQNVDSKWQTLEKLPVTFDYYDAKLSVKQSNYIALFNWPEVDRNDGTLVDLWGEGYAGWLYRHDNIWGYQAPIRSEHALDEVSYAPWQPLPLVPSINDDQNLLADINGDGFLDWVILRPDINGFFTLNPQNELDQQNHLSCFTPFSAFPSEFFQPQSQFADLVGNGLMGITLIGPHTVRFYANKRDGFEPAVIYCNDECLAMPSLDEREWLALANPLGSGSAHLVRIRHNKVTCWPGLGYGKFGKPIELTLPAQIDDESKFRPKHLYMIDIDGSGTDDLLYATPQGLNYYQNQSGNAFSAPIVIPWPVGFNWDDINSLQFAALSGQGMSLVVNQRHINAQHWRLDLTSQQPWLLKTINNQRGFRSELRYRSSANYWLDEKKQFPQRRSQLPLRLNLLAETLTIDEITRHSSKTFYNYFGGRYDANKRRYCGFYLIDKIETCNELSNTGLMLQKPYLLRSWYHTGSAQDASKREGYFSASSASSPSLALSDSYLTQWQQDGDCILATDISPKTVQQLHYALKGALLREELYDVDNLSVPFSIKEYRYQARLLQQNDDTVCVAPLALETLEINQQQQVEDIAYQQNVVMQYSQYGEVLRNVSIAYPRKRQTTTVPYPNVNLQQWQNSFDQAQYLCWFTETEQRWHAFTTDECWHLGIIDHAWQSSLHIADSKLKKEILFSYESLQATDSPIAANKSRTLLNRNKIYYQLQEQEISYPPRVIYQENAVLNEATLQPYLKQFSQEQIEEQLKSAGYQQRKLSELNQTIWVVPSNYISYLDADGFYLPKSSKNLRDGLSQIRYSSYYRYGETFIDPFEQQIKVVASDYRFWQPTHILDINNNSSEIRLNGFGEVVALSHYGSEAGKKVGFTPVSEFKLNDNLSLQQALDKVPELLGKQASVILYHDSEFNREVHLPAWSLTISAIDYPDDKKSANNNLVNSNSVNYKVEIVYFDGSGKPWQHFSLDNKGDAYQRNKDGYLQMEENQLLQKSSEIRWLVSIANESTLSGNQIRSYSPWFMDSHLPIWDFRLTHLMPYEQTYYDAQGKVIINKNAQGYLRYQRYFPWFHLSYDENDSLLLEYNSLSYSDSESKRATNALYGVRNENSVLNRFAKFGYHGELVDIDNHSMFKTYTNKIQRYYLNAGQFTYLPDAGVTLTPMSDITKPYSLPVMHSSIADHQLIEEQNYLRNRYNKVLNSFENSESNLFKGDISGQLKRLNDSGSIF